MVMDFGKKKRLVIKRLKHKMKVVSLTLAMFLSKSAQSQDATPKRDKTNFDTEQTQKYLNNAPNVFDIQNYFMTPERTNAIIDSMFMDAYLQFFDNYTKEAKMRTSAISKVRGGLNKSEKTKACEKEIRRLFDAPNEYIPMGLHCSWCGNTLVLRSGFCLNICAPTYDNYENVRGTANVFADLRRSGKKLKPYANNDLFIGTSNEKVNIYDKIKKDMMNKRIPQIYLVSEGGHFAVWTGEKVKTEEGDDKVLIIRYTFNKSYWNDVADYSWGQRRRGEICNLTEFLTAKVAKQKADMGLFNSDANLNCMGILHEFTELFTSQDGKTVASPEKYIEQFLLADTYQMENNLRPKLPEMKVHDESKTDYTKNFDTKFNIPHSLEKGAVICNSLPKPKKKHLVAMPTEQVAVLRRNRARSRC